MSVKQRGEGVSEVSGQIPLAVTKWIFGRPLTFRAHQGPPLIRGPKPSNQVIMKLLISNQDEIHEFAKRLHKRNSAPSMESSICCTRQCDDKTIESIKMKSFVNRTCPAHSPFFPQRLNSQNAKILTNS